MKKDEKKPSSKTGQWLKNSGKSLKEVFADWFISQPLFTIVGDEIKLIKKENRKKKRSPSEKKTLKEHLYKLPNMAIQKYVDEYAEETNRDLKADVKETFNSFMNSLRTGNFNDKKEISFFDDDEDMLQLFNDIEADWDDDEDEVVGESNNMIGGKMNLRGIRDEYLKEMKKYKAIAESDSTLAGPIPNVSQEINRISDKIGHIVEFCDSEPSNELFAKVKLNKSKQEIMNDIRILIEDVSKSGSEITDAYKDQIVNQIIALFALKADFDVKDIYERPADEILHDINNNIQSLTDDEVFLDEIHDKSQPIISAVKKYENDLTFKPNNPDTEDLVSHIKNNEGTPIGELLTSVSEDSAMFVDPERITPGMKTLGTIGGLLGVTGSIANVVSMLIATPINLMSLGKISKLEKEFGSALTIRQPLIASDDLSKDIIGTYSKYMETDTAIKIRQILSSSVAALDGGSLQHRSKNVLKDKFTPMNQEMRRGKNNVSKDNYDKVMSAFSASADLLDMYGCVLRRNPLEGGFIHRIQSMVNRGEAGEFVNDNRHSPTSTIDVEVMYRSIKNLTEFGNNTNTKKASVTVDVVGRKLPYDDVVKTFIELNRNYFDKIKVTAQEVNTEKIAKNAIKLIKSKGTNTEKKLLSSNKFSDIINKIENVKTPLFHVMISVQAYMELKENGVDLKDDATYNKIMKRLPIISIAIVDEDTEIVTVSSGIHKNYVDIDFKRLEGEISRYEKELQSMIKFGMQR